MKAFNMTRFFVLILLVAAMVFAESVEGTGYGITKNEALMLAKRDALSKGIGQLLIGSTEVENYMVKRDLIITKTMGNIKEYKILEETQGVDQVWVVKILAEVSADGLRNDLAALMILKESIGNPRVAFLLDENNMDIQTESSGKAEATLIDFFKSKSFEVVDPSEALKFSKTPEGIKAIAGDPEAAAKLGSQMNAEVIIIGKIQVKATDVSSMKAFAGTSMKSASANVSLKAINVGNRRIMASKSEDAPAIHVNQNTAGMKAIEKACVKLMEDENGFFQSLVSSWQATANDGGVFEVQISNVTSYKVSTLVKQALMTEVSKMDVRSFTKPQMIMDVNFAGTVDDLCSRIDGLKRNSLIFSVESCQGSSIGLKVEESKANKALQY